MFTRTPGTIRSEDEDGEDDPAVEPVPAGIALATESGIPLTDENGAILLVT